MEYMDRYHWWPRRLQAAGLAQGHGQLGLAQPVQLVNSPSNLLGLSQSIRAMPRNTPYFPISAPDTRGMGASNTRKRKEPPSDEGSDSNSQPDSPPKQRTTLCHSPIFETCTIYRVHCNGAKDHQNHLNITYFQDAPRLFAGDSKASALRGKRSIADVADFIDSNSEIALILYRDYSCETYHRAIEPEFRALERPNDSFNKSLLPYFYRLDNDGMPASSHAEAMLVASDELRDIIIQLTGLDPRIIADLENPRRMRELVTQVYHYRGISEGSVLVGNLDEKYFDIAVAFVEFMKATFWEEYSEADALFEAGSVNNHHLPKLFAPQDVLLRIEQGHPCAYILDSFLESTLTLSCWAWRFDGRFWKYQTAINIKWPGLVDKVPITDLSIFPLAYAAPDVRQLLESSGREFWSLRKGKYVSYLPTATQRDVQTVSLDRRCPHIELSSSFILDSASVHD